MTPAQEYALKNQDKYDPDETPILGGEIGHNGGIYPMPTPAFNWPVWPFYVFACTALTIAFVIMLIVAFRSESHVAWGWAVVLLAADVGCAIKMWFSDK